MPQPLPISSASTQTSKPNRALMLMSPSGISLFLCLALGAAVPLWVALLTHYKSSALEQQLAYWQAERGGTPYGEVLTDTSNHMASYFSSGLFWIIVGLVTLVAITSIVKAIKAVYSVERELKYINQDRPSMVRETALHLGISLSAVGLIVLLTILAFKRIAVWSIEQTSIAMQHLPFTTAVLHILIIALVLAILLHVYVVLMRLALLRSRVLSRR